MTAIGMLRWNKNSVKRKYHFVMMFPDMQESSWLLDPVGLVGFYVTSAGVGLRALLRQRDQGAMAEQSDTGMS